MVAAAIATAVYFVKNAMSTFGGVVPDPAPAHRLRERGPYDDVDPCQGSARQWSAVRPAVAAQGGVGGVGIAAVTSPTADVTEMRVKVAVEHRAGLADRGRRPAGRGDGVPRFEQFADRGAPTARTACAAPTIVEVRYVDIVPDVRVVQAVDFVSDDPAFAGTMTMTWEVTAVD